VWEVVKAAREVDERGAAAVPAVAEILSLPEERIRLALSYYGSYPDEIDAEIAQADEQSQVAEAGWRAQQQLLA